MLTIGHGFKFNVEKNLITLMSWVAVLEILFFIASVDNLGLMLFMTTLFYFVVLVVLSRCCLDICSLFLLLIFV